jgi:hypothetical protein
MMYVFLATALKLLYPLPCVKAMAEFTKPHKSDDEEYDSTVPSTVGRSSRVQSSPYSQYSDLSRPEIETASSAPGSQAFSINQDSGNDAESWLEYTAQPPNVHEAGYLGHICEVQWLRSLKQRLQIPRSMSPYDFPHPSETNFYLDDDGIRLLNSDNPFLLPLESLATALSRCYFQTIYVTFPIIASDIENQLQVYYHSMKSGHTVMFPQSWYAIINIVFAIGARFSHITNAEWHSDPLDEMVYISRACQLLGLNDAAVVLLAPDLPRVQVGICYTNVPLLLIIVGYRAPRSLLYDYWSRQQVCMRMTWV